MAAAFDAVTTQAGAATNFNHTPVGTPTLAVFTAHWDGGDATSDITAVTYGGSAMTQKAFIDHQGATGGPTTSHVVEIWTLESPSAGVQAVAITRAGTAAATEVYSLSTYTGTGLVGTASTASDNANDKTSASITGISSETDGIVIDALTTQEGGENHTANGGQTERWDTSDGATRAAGSTEAGAASVDVGWSWTTGTRYAYAAIPVAPATGATVPKAPTSAAGTASGDSITMTWTDNTSGTAQHRVYYKRSTDSIWTQAGITEAGETSFVFEWLTQGTDYDVGVTSFNANGESPMSSDTDIATGTVRLVSGSFL